MTAAAGRAPAEDRNELGQFVPGARPGTGEKIDWALYAGVPYERLPTRVKRAAATAASRLGIPGLTGAEYAAGRARGTRICVDCQPHWQPGGRFSSARPYCAEHSRAESKLVMARMAARARGRPERLAVANVRASSGTCLACGSPFAKRAGACEQLCRECKRVEKLTTYFATQAKADASLPRDYVARRLGGERYCKRHRGYFRPRTKKATVCRVCRPRAAASLKGRAAKWAVFARNRGLDPARHVEMMARGFKVCRKCLNYNSPESHKTLCAHCGKNPRCVYVKRKKSHLNSEEGAAC